MIPLLVIFGGIGGLAMVTLGLQYKMRCRNRSFLKMCEYDCPIYCEGQIEAECIHCQKKDPCWHYRTKDDPFLSD